MTTGASAAAAAYRLMMERARADPNVLGVVVVGSRVVDAFVTPTSDVDCFVVTREPALEAWPFRRGSGVETVAVTLAEFDRHARFGTSTFWNRPALLHARLEFDRTDGELARMLEARRRLDPEEADGVVREGLGDYINSLYRALKNLRDGRDLAGRLDALESLSPLLATVFALEGRVRPFNKWLLYELDRSPVSIRDFPARLAKLAEAPDPADLRAMFRDVEVLARSKGFAAIIDDWDPDVPFLRGDAAGVDGSEPETSR